MTSAGLILNRRYDPRMSRALVRTSPARNLGSPGTAAPFSGGCSSSALPSRTCLHHRHLKFCSFQDLQFNRKWAGIFSKIFWVYCQMHTASSPLL